MINFTHLLAFYHVAKAGSVSAGAEKIRVSQPAVTREIRELEERHGVQLFDRLPRGVALTESGKCLFAYAERIFSIAGAAETHLRELAGLSSGHVRIGASATLGVYVVPEIIARFNADHPRVTIDLTVTNAGSVEAGLRSHAFTLGFIEGPFDDSQLESCLFGYDEIGVIAASRDPRAGARLSPYDVTDQVVILNEVGSVERCVVETAYAQLGLGIQPRMSVSDIEAIKRMVISQNSLAYLPLLSVAGEISRRELTVLDVDGLRVERSLQMVWLKGCSLSPSTRAFFELVREMIPRPGIRPFLTGLRGYAGFEADGPMQKAERADAVT